MRRSSRGNPWHDARGRFCSGPQAGGVTKSERTPEEYEQRTKERFADKEPIRTLGDLPKNGWSGGVLNDNGSSVWSKDGYTLVTARHGEPVESAGYTKRVGDSVEFYDKGGHLIASVPADVANEFKTTKADTFTLRTPDGYTFQMKSLEDANKFAEADKKSSFGKIQKRFENRYNDYWDFHPGKIKQPVELVEVRSAVGIKMDDGIMFHCDGHDYVFGEAKYDEESRPEPYSISYNHFTESFHYQTHIEQLEWYTDEVYEPGITPYSQGMDFIENYSVVDIYAIADVKTGKIVHTSTGVADYTNEYSLTVLKDGRKFYCGGFADDYHEELVLFWDAGIDDEAPYSYMSNRDDEFPGLAEKVSSQMRHIRDGK